MKNGNSFNCKKCIHNVAEDFKTCSHDTPPIGECLSFRTPKDGLNLSNRSGESPSYRLPGTWNCQ